jgi:hypothetical protein
MAESIQHERELREQWQASHAEVHVAEREALRLASEDISRRLSEMNQFRAQLEKERSEYVPRTEHELLAERIKVLEIARGEQTGKSAAYASIAAFVGIVAAIVMRYWK